MAVIEKDLGPVSAYAVAVAHGYTGTEAEWEALISNSAINAQSAGASATAAAASALEAAQQKTQAQAQAAAALAHEQNASRSAQTAGQANSYAQMAKNNAAVSAANASNAQTAAEAAQAAAEAAVTGAEAAQTAAEAAVTDAQTAKTAAETAAATAAAAYGTDLLADDYSTSKTYAVGDYVIYSGNLYRCTTAITTAEAWTAAHWTRAQVGPDLDDLKSALDENGILPGALSPTLYSSCGIYSNGMVYELSGYNVYVYDVANIDYVAVNGGSIYAFYATLPVVNSTQSIDTIRHIRTLSNVTLKVPYGANYIGIRHTSEPVVKNVDAIKSNVDRLEYLKAFNTKNVSYTKTGYFINMYGTDVANADYSCTDYIEITGESIIKIHTFFTGNARHALYDADKNLIATIENAGSIGDVLTINTTANTKYIRFSINIAYIDDEYAGIMFIANDIASIIKPNERTAYNGYEINVFKHGICIGDSLTAGTFNYMDGSTEKSDYVVAGYSYPVQLSKMTGIEIYVSAVGGQTSYEWYLDHTGATIAGFDFAIIQFGVNDALEYHDWTSDSITGFNGIINLLKTANEGIKIFVSTIIPALAYQGDAFNHVNSGIRELVASYNNDGDDNVILLDMALYANTKLKQYNAGHLTALGYSRLAKDYMNYISWHIKENPEQFRAVQFIGTNKEIPSVYE